VKEVFEEIFGEGTIARVDVVKPRSEDESDSQKTRFNRVYIHFKYWPGSCHELRRNLLAGGDIKIMYDDPWYWKCLVNRFPRVPEERKRSKAYVKMGPKVPDAPEKMAVDAQTPAE